MALSDAGRGALGEAASSLGYALEEPVDEEEARVAAASLQRKLQRARAGIGPTVASDVALLPMELAAFDVAAKRRRRQAADDLQWRVPEDPNARVPEEPHIVVDGIDVTRFGYDTLLRAREGTLRRGDDERARREFEALTRQAAEEQVRAQQLARLVARERLQGAEGENGGARGGEQRDRGRRGGRRGVQERRR